MVIYSATLNNVTDGTTLDLNVDIGDSQIIVQRVRLLGIQAKNMFKRYRTGNPGSRGVFARFEVLRWFSDNSTVLSFEYETIEICGRWLGVLTSFGNPESLNVYMKKKVYKNTDWDKADQETLVDEWFDGQEVRVPGGDLLPVFHIWGKPQLIGGKATQINVL